MRRFEDLIRLSHRSEDRRNFSAGIRLAQMLVLSGVIGLAACTDSTAPEKAAVAATPASNPAAPDPGSPLGQLGPWVGDATSWVVPSMVDPTSRDKLQSSIDGLGGHLTAGQYDLAREDIATIRSIVNAASETELVELGPIEVTLCVIEQTLSDAGK